METLLGLLGSPVERKVGGTVSQGGSRLVVCSFSEAHPRRRLCPHDPRFRLHFLFITGRTLSGFDHVLPPVTLLDPLAPRICRPLSFSSFFFFCSSSLLPFRSNFLKWFIMKREIENYIEDLHMSVSVMKDEKLKVRDLHVSHTLGFTGDWNTKDRDEVTR